MGLLFVQAVQNVDIPIMAAYLLMVVADLRHHQSRGRYPLHRGRSAPALDHQPPGLKRDSHVRRRRPAPGRTKRAARRASGRGWLGRALDSDLFYSFRRSRLTMVAAAVTLLFFLLAIFASAARGAEPVRSGAAATDEFAHLAAVDRRRPEPVPARHRRTGPRRVLRHPLWLAHFARGRRARRAVRRRARHRARPDRRLCRRRRRQPDHAHRRRAAHLPGHPDRAARSTASPSRCSATGSTP